MAPPVPPQPPPNFDLDASFLTQAAVDYASASAKVWDEVAQIAPEDATFANAIRPIILDENKGINANLQLGFLQNVSPSKEIRDASKEARRILDEHSVDRFSRREIFKIVDAVWQKNEAIDPESRLFLEKLRHSFIRTGQGLQDENARSSVKEALVKLNKLNTDYIRNIDSDVGGLWLTLDELQGVPQSYLDRWEADGDKRWINRKVPNYTALMSNAVKAEVRQKAWFNRENGIKDLNGPLLKEILVLRDQVARTLGYKHQFDLRENDRILKTDEAMRFLENIRGILQELGEHELEALKSLKVKTVQQEGSEASPLSKHFLPWDRLFYARLRKINELQIDQELVAEYFPWERCLPRLLSILGALFGMKFFKYPRNSPEIATWHPDVDVYAVWDDDEGGDFLGYLYLDVFPRDHKFGHKAHFRVLQGFVQEDGSRHYPCSVFVSNYSPPSATRPSLLKVGEVVNCFHELGHSLHNLSSKTQYARFHGTSVPRDFAEIPSIMLEHIFWNPDILRMISGHYSTDQDSDKEEKLPDDLIDRLIASRHVGVGTSGLSNLRFSLFDVKVHTPPDHETICNMNLALEFNKLSKEICLMSGPDDVGFEPDDPHSFSRLRYLIGYNTSYYTYLLSQSFSYDIFESKFRHLLPSNTSASAKVWQNMVELIPLELRKEFGQYRRIVLQPGSNVTSYPGLLKDFLGREPSHDAYFQMLKARTQIDSSH